MEEVAAAKAYLKTASSANGTNLYDHLTTVIATMLKERPANATDILESVSLKVKATNSQTESVVAEAPELPEAVVVAELRNKLFVKDEDVDLDEDDDVTPPVANVVDTCKLFEDAGVGVGSEESFRIMLALKKLVADQPVTDVHFWGKIMGTERDYIVAQCVYKEGEEPQLEEEAEPEPEPAEEDEEDALPKSQFVPPRKLPVEPYGTGVNKYVYFVCNEPGETWTALPMAEPGAIVISRQIKKFFTGRLDAPIAAYPPFTGGEAALLRATIARISAETHLSPLGMFTFDEDEDEDEDGGRSSYIKDEEYEGVSKSALLDSTMSGWAHHVQHILPQGRCKWVNPNPPKEDADDDEDEEEEEEEVEPETGPPLLTPAQEDEPVDDGAAWSVKLTSTLNASYAGVVASSNKWPGAHALSYDKGRKFENVYIGHGIAYSPEAYSPPLPPISQAEYVVDEGVTEAADPTREEEEAFEAEQAKNDEDGDDEEDD